MFETKVNIYKMSELSKYQQIKMYLPINGYDSIKELAADWDVHENSIRYFCEGKFTSPKLEALTEDFIEEGDRKLAEHRKNKVTADTP